ncbi:radical SAM family heme chaperone HemW [Thalassorhabdus alkalitolerans]|uniref:Heme chaperone HemW n=1 Tax=Thalassorhabdus alkalitolerans TaxID=2282697 RepID=A0ABW0YMQ6_9BACI
MAKSIYIHIPFCEHICFYCDFNKVYVENQPVDAYIDALITEMEMVFSAQPPDQIETVYIGGGTPTALSSAQLDKLLRAVDEMLSGHPVKEYTVEVNPGGADAEKLKVMSQYSINRLSLGVQSFDDDLLKAIGRTHREKDVYFTIEEAKKNGFSNISIDLMFGLPNQTIEQWRESIMKTVALNLPHVSAYSLKIEEKTIFHNMMRKGKLSLVPQDDEAEMYEILLQQMSRSLLHPYEISNFAKEGYESLHNQTYWANEEYYGFGAGAHGYLAGVRYANIGPLPHYLSAVQENNLPIKESHNVTLQEKMEEEMFMGLRMDKGVDKQRFLRKYQKSIEEVFSRQISSLEEEDLIINEMETIRLTQRGKLLGNEVFERFLLI